MASKKSSPKAAPAKKGKEMKTKAPTGGKKAAAVLSKAPTPVKATEELEGDEDEMEGAASTSGSAGGDLQAAMTAENAAATPMSLKNYRNHPDMENFFRFIYENDLRIEALQIIDEVLTNRPAKKMGKKAERELS